MLLLNSILNFITIVIKLVCENYTDKKPELLFWEESLINSHLNVLQIGLLSIM